MTRLTSFIGEYMQVWQLQVAKAKFSELVKLARKTPQIITVRGVEEVVVISKKAYDKLSNKPDNLFEFFQESPLKGVELDIERDKSLPREGEFEV